jgi:phosphatidylglycerol:prolipoprotein diacylglycerol transferase
MRSTLLEIESLALWHVLLVAAVLMSAAALLVWRERRLGRVPPEEYGKSLASALGLALGVALLFYAVSRFIHPIQVRSYGVMLMLAFAAGIGIAAARSQLYRIEALNVVDLSLFILFGSILGARLLYIALNWSSEYAQDPQAVFNVWEGGLAFHGGLIGGSAGAWLFCARRRLRVTVMGDLVAPSVAFGYALARIGCFLNGCCGGGPTHLPWAVDFVHDDVGGAVHPTQLYSSVEHLVIGLVLLRLASRIRVPGHLGLWFLLLSSIARAGDEVFRRGYSAQLWGWLPALTQAQAASLGLIVVSAALLWVTRRRVGYPLPPLEPPKSKGKGTGRR